MTNTRGPKVNFQRRAIIAGAVAASTQLIAPVLTFANTKQPTSTGSNRMDIDRFVSDCIAANEETDAQAARDLALRGLRRSSP